MREEKISPRPARGAARGVPRILFRCWRAICLLGMAYGILAASKGLCPLVILLMSLLIYSGSMQFVAVSLLTAAFDPVAAFLVTLVVNARYLFYGIAMLEEFRGMGAATVLSDLWNDR